MIPMNIHSLRELGISEKALAVYCDSDFSFARVDGLIGVYNGRINDKNLMKVFENPSDIEAFLVPPERWWK